MNMTAKRNPNPKKRDPCDLYSAVRGNPKSIRKDQIWGIGFDGLIDALSAQTKAADNGDLSRAGAILTAQALTIVPAAVNFGG